MNDQVYRILLVDDERSIREPLAQFLQTKYNFVIETAASRAGAWQRVQQAEEPYDVVLIDDMLLEYEDDPDAFPMSVGIDLMTQIKGYAPHTECILFTGWSGTERGLEALRAGAYRYMKKPFDHEELAMTIQMAAQHYQLKQDFVMADQQKRWLQTFMKIGQVTTSIHSLDEVLAEVHTQIGKLMDVTEMDIVLYDEESQTLSFELCYDRGEKQEKWKRPFGEGFTEWVITQNQSLLIKHFDKEKDTIPAIANIVVFKDEKENEITQSYLGVPLIARNNVIGVINIQSYASHQFNETDMYVLSAVASQVANAIHNGRLFSNLYEARERRQALLQSSLDAIVAIDNEKHITVFNKQAEKFFGHPTKEMLGKSTAILFEDVEVGRKIFDELDGDISIAERPINFKHRNGHPLPGLFSATVIYDEDDHPIGQAGFIRDLQSVKVLEARQQAWAEVSEAVTTSQELGDILRLIMSSVDHIIPTATGGEFHLHKDGILQLAANTLNFSDNATIAFSLKVEQGIAGNVFASGKHRIVKDSKKDSQFKAFDHLEAPTYRSLICVPLQVRKQRLGTLTLTSEAVNVFREVDVPLLMPFARQAAIAIKNKQLLDEATKGLSTLKSISEASRNLVSQRKPEEVLQAIVKEAKGALQAWRVSVVLIDRDGCPHNLASVSYVPVPNLETVIRKKVGISARVMKSMNPCFIEDVANSKENLNEDMKQNNVLATACLPLTLGKEAIGVMWIQYQQPHLFTPTEREALIIYSEQAALAYDKSRRMQELNHMREALVAMSGANDLQAVLTQIVCSARIVLDADSAAIWSYDDIRQRFLLDNAVADGIEASVWKRFKEGEAPQAGQTAFTVMERQIITVENVANQAQYPFLGETTKRLLNRVGIQSFLGLALMVGDEKFGVLYVNYNQLRHFTQEEESTALIFADQVALALKKARLLEQVRKARDTAQIVANVTALETENTLKAVAQGMVEAVNCDAVTLYVYDEKRDYLSYPPTMGGHIKFPPKTHLEQNVPSDSIVLKLLNEEKPLIVDNSTTHPLFRELRFTKEEKIKSLIAIPLKTGKEKVGVMFVNYRQLHRFTHDEIQNIELFANQAAVAIRNAQLYEEVQERSDIHDAFYKASQAIINSNLNQQATLDVILKQVVNATTRNREDASYACIRRVENNVSHLMATYPPELSNIIKKRLSDKINIGGKNGERIGIVGRAASTGEVQRVGDVRQDTDYRKISPNVKSVLAVPFQIGNAVVVINVDHKDKNAFQAISEKTLQVLVSQAAVAIKNAQLYQTFRKVAEALSGAKELDKVLDVLIREAMASTNTQMANIIFWDLESNRAGDALRVERDGRLHPYANVTRTNGITQQIVDSEKPLITSDKRLAKNPNPIYKERGFLAEVGVPIINREEVLGVLYIRHPNPRDFSKQEVEMLVTLGKQAGVAIARAMDFEKMKQLKGFIGNKTAVEWIQMVSTTWGHSLKREVGIARGRMKLLSTLANSKDRKEFTEEIASLEKVLERIANLPITAPLSYEDVTKSILINDLLQTYLTRLWKHARYKKIPLAFDLQSNLDKSASVWASPEWLRRGFELILDNAIWAMMQENTPNPEVIVTTCLQDSQITITFENNGPDISDEVLERFSKGLAIPKKDGDRGSGIGLQLTKTIFETYRGSMQIYKRKPQGAKVVFTLPIYQSDKESQ